MVFEKVYSTKFRNQLKLLKDIPLKKILFVLTGKAAFSDNIDYISNRRLLFSNFEEIGPLNQRLKLSANLCNHGYLLNLLFQHSCHHNRSHHITGDCCPSLPASRIEVGLRGRARPQRQLAQQRTVSGVNLTNKVCICRS